jgi:flagellar biosynthesis chaperone FliJ
MEMRDPPQRSTRFPDDGSDWGDLQGRIHHLESTLAQRQEEIAQLRAELEQKQHSEDPAPATDDSQETIARLGSKLADADAWVFKLAQDRRDLEVQNASLDRKLKAASRLYECASAELKSVSKKSRRLSDTITRLSAEKDAAEEVIHLRMIEIGRFNELVRYKDDTLAQVEYREEWLRRVLSVLTRDYSSTFKNWLHSLLPAFLAVRRQRARLKKAGLFDGESYLLLHSDVARSNTDPLHHYVNHGIREGRAIGN